MSDRGASGAGESLAALHAALAEAHANLAEWVADLAIELKDVRHRVAQLEADRCEES